MNKKAINKISAINNISKKKSLKIPPINNYSSRKEWEAACWDKILESKELLSLFITSHERHNLVGRVAVMDRLISGKSYREISKELWLSLQTISAIKKAITEKAYRSYLERSKKERKRRKYSLGPISAKSKVRFPGRLKRTKYGRIYMPY